MLDPVRDRTWFEQATLEALPELLGLARRLTRNREDAEDLAAEAIGRAWLHRGTLRDRERFSGWIVRILTNLFLSQRRSEATHPHESLDLEGDFSLFERLHQPFLLWWGGPEQEFLDRLLREDLIRAIEALETVEPAGPIERVQAWFLLQAYRRRLRAMTSRRNASRSRS